MFLPPGAERAWRGTYASYASATLKAPVEGNRTIPVDIVWSRDGEAPSYTVRFNAREQRTSPITQIASLHVSNIHSTVPVRILFPDTGFELELGPGLEGFYPVVTNGLEFVAYTPSAPLAADGCVLQVLNFLPPPVVIGGGGGGGATVGVRQIDTGDGLAGGPIVDSGTISLITPVAITRGGTGQATPDKALDALVGVGGALTGMLVRFADGSWSVDPIPSGSGPTLPLVIGQGGTGATTGFLGLDALSAAGTQTGNLQRASNGTWSLNPGSGGTITGVTATAPLTGGGTAGNVTIAMPNPLPVANGGTGAGNAAAALATLGGLPLAGGHVSGDLGVDGTLTSYTQFYGVNGDFNTTLTAPTMPLGTNDRHVATTAFVIAQQATGAYLPISGGTLTGILTIQTVGYADLWLGKAAGAYGSRVIGSKGGLARWVLELGNASPETGGNTGSDFAVNHFDDAGGYISTALAISRASGITQIESLAVNGNTTTSGKLTVNGGNLLLGAGATGYITRPAATDNVVISTEAAGNLNQIALLADTTYANKNFTVYGAQFVWGPLYAYGDLDVNGTTTLMQTCFGPDVASRKGWVDGSNGNAHFDGVLSIGTSNLLYLWNDGTSHIESEAKLWINNGGQPTQFSGQLTVSNNNISQLAPAGQNCLFYQDISGLVTWTCGPVAAPIAVVSTGSYTISTPSVMAFWIDTTGNTFSHTGLWSGSDPILKQDVKPFSRGLDAIKSLSPVAFRYKPGTPWATEDEPSPVRIGLMADEVFPYLPEACGDTTLHLDGVEQQIGTLQGETLIYPMINAIKELSDQLDAVKRELAMFRGIADAPQRGTTRGKR